MAPAALPPVTDPSRIQHFTGMGLTETQVQKTQHYSSLHPDAAPFVSIDKSIIAKAFHEGPGANSNDAGKSLGSSNTGTGMVTPSTGGAMSLGDTSAQKQLNPPNTNMDAGSASVQGNDAYGNNVPGTAGHSTVNADVNAVSESSTGSGSTGSGAGMGTTGGLGIDTRLGLSAGTGAGSETKEMGPSSNTGTIQGATGASTAVGTATGTDSLPASKTAGEVDASGTSGSAGTQGVMGISTNVSPEKMGTTANAAAGAIDPSSTSTDGLLGGGASDAAVTVAS